MPRHVAEIAARMFPDDVEAANDEEEKGRFVLSP
jgi:hypothetical protein